jgi:hypothetical protein
MIGHEDCMQVILVGLGGTGTPPHDTFRVGHIVPKWPGIIISIYYVLLAAELLELA